MRKVMLIKHKRNPETGKYDEIDDKMANFHRWGLDCEEGNDDRYIGTYSTAICELPDGTVVNPPATMIRFMDPPPAGS